MTTKNITIAISGEVATGKSRIAYLIKKTLKQHGFEVNFVNDIDYPTEAVFDKDMERNFDDAIKGLSQKTKITIVQAQLMRGESQIES